MILRPGTADELIVSEVYQHNQYRLPCFASGGAEKCDHPFFSSKRFDYLVFNANLHGSIYIDIGAHIGCFTVLSCQLGATVYAYEPHLDNFSYLQKNIKVLDKDRVFISNRPVWRSDIDEQIGVDQQEMPLIREDDLNYAGMPNPAQYRFSPDGHDLTTPISLDSIISEIESKHGKSPDLIKIDCESAEFAILYTSKLIGRVNSIAGELHFGDHGPKEEHSSFNGYQANLWSFMEFLSDQKFSKIEINNADYDHKKSMKNARSIIFRADK